MSANQSWAGGTHGEHTRWLNTPCEARQNQSKVDEDRSCQIERGLESSRRFNKGENVSNICVLHGKWMFLAAKIGCDRQGVGPSPLTVGPLHFARGILGVERREFSKRKTSATPTNERPQSHLLTTTQILQLFLAHILIRRLRLL